MQQLIDYSLPDDGLGDKLRNAFIKTDNNFTELYNSKVDKVAGKGLTENDFTDAYQTKLDGIETGAQVNVNADFGETDPFAPGFILNKPPSLYSAAGYFHYSDLATQTTPLVVLPSIAKKLTNDTLGAYTNLDQAPYGVATIWNSTTNNFDFNNLSIGDTMQLRVDMLVSSSSVNQAFSIFVRLGIGTASQYDLQITNFNIKAITSNLPMVRDMSFSIDNEDWRTAPAAVYILSDDDATVKVNGWYIPIIRKSVNIIDVLDSFKYKGELNLTSPILTNGVGVVGDTYKVVQSGNYDFGAGPIYFYGGDFIFYDGLSYDLFVYNSQVLNAISTDSNNALELGTDNKLFVAESNTGIQSIVAGTNITVNNTDPLNPIISASGGGGDQYYVVHFGIAKNANYVGDGNWQTPDRNGSTIFNDTSSFGNYYNGTIITDARLGKIKLPFDCQLVDGSFYLTHAGGTNGTENLRIIGFEVSGTSVVGTTTMASASYTQGNSTSNGNLGSFSPTTFLKDSFVTYSNQSKKASVYIAEGIITLVFKKI